MPYVVRDENLNIVSLHQDSQGVDSEELPMSHPDVLKFLNSQGDETHTALIHLAESDLAMARVIEDLVETLIYKGVITMDDLPVAAQKKLTSRQTIRGSLDDALEVFGGGKFI